MPTIPIDQTAPYPGGPVAAVDPNDTPPKRQRRRRPPPRGPPTEYLTRAELLALVPLSMSSIDNLEKRGVFPSRFRIEPTTRIAWRRSEVERFMRQRAAKRVYEAQHAT